MFCIDGRMTSNGYGEVLKNHLVDISGSYWIFQEDNTPVHRSKVKVTWFKSLRSSVLLWPSLSPDLNSIENVGGLLAMKVFYSEGMQCRTKEQLKSAILKSWKEIIIDQLRKIESI